jgi:hypothetical protein
MPGMFVFNCPDIDWTNMITKIHANDKEIQKSLIEIRAQAGLTQMLCLFFSILFIF